MIKRLDLVILTGALLLAGLLGLLLFQGEGATLVVEINGTVVEKISLSSLQEETKYSYETPSGRIEILADREGAEILSSGCENKLCVKSGKIKKNGQSILCLPGRTVLRLEGAEEAPLDGVTG